MAASRFEQAMERITRLPVAQKVVILVAVAVAVTVGNYFMFIDDSHTAYENSRKEMLQLEDTMIQNQQIANNLGQFQKQKEALEVQLAKALTELPEESDIEGLIDSLNEMGVKAGLQINTIDPKPETKGAEGLYAEIPLAMTVTGNYHEIAVFFDSVRQLKRIVNITNIKLTHPRPKNEKMLIDASYMATSFRFIPQAKPEKKEEKKDEKKEGDKK